MGSTGSLFMIWPVSGDWRLCRCIWLSNIKNLMMKTTLCKWWSISVSTTTWTINADILNIYIHIHIWAISVHNDEFAKKSYANKEWKNEEGTQSTEPAHGRSVLQIKCASNEKQNYAQWILQIFYVFCTCFLPELSDATCLPSGCYVILHRIDNPNHEWGFHRKYNT